MNGPTTTQKPRKLSVDLLPQGNYSDVAIVMDILRSTTTVTTYFERGAKEVYFSSQPEVGLAAKQAHKDLILAGERECLPLPGFDYGNSPVEISKLDFSGKSIIMNTTNGTGAAHLAAQTARHVLLAGLLNAQAVAEYVAHLATQEITIICAGTSSKISLEDVYGAGILIDKLLQLGNWSLNDNAHIAYATALKNSATEALSNAENGHLLTDLGLSHDIAFCGQTDQSHLVPVMQTESDILGTLKFLAS